ncbi:CRISPR-associated helicase/endonuclease Cas3, partial [Mycobacterium tuberculosis]|nr:CRISPR-associated helicase/endonuclease Cas3 [Mycobacterium tuberculosis]
MLMHSRFILADRLHREGQVKELLGPPAIGRRRPPGMVIVSTQVIESSLDIDADLMYSDLAPIDLILQRAGRLHR